MIRVYLAGPDVFERDPTKRAQVLKKICQQHGLEGIFPLDTVVQCEILGSPEHGRLISRANEELIRGCEGVLANLTPFRGPSADAGTIYEVGYACGLKKVVVGYTFSNKDFYERTLSWATQLPHQGQLIHRTDGSTEDNDGMLIESFGLMDNLMIPTGIETSGGEVIESKYSSESEYTIIERGVMKLAFYLKIRDIVSVAREI